MPPTARPGRAGDRAGVLALMGDPRTIDSPGHRIAVLEDGGIVGATVWLDSGDGRRALLGGVVTLPGVARADFYRLIAFVCRQAIAAGFTSARFELRERALLAVLEHDFTIVPEPAGWNPRTGQPVAWDIVVDLADALAQLARVI